MNQSIAPPPNDGETPEPDWGFIVTHATDPYWWELTGMCGGCGRAECHDGKCPTIPHHIGYCTTCPTRKETGEVR